MGNKTIILAKKLVLFAQVKKKMYLCSQICGYDNLTIRNYRTKYLNDIQNNQLINFIN